MPAFDGWFVTDFLQRKDREKDSQVVSDKAEQIRQWVKQKVAQVCETYGV